MALSDSSGNSEGRPLTAVLIRSPTRFVRFKEKLIAKGVHCVVLDFADPSWSDFDYRDADILIYYPSFAYSSNYPLALHHVLDNFAFIANNYPHLCCYPDPCLLPYYNDKYRQFLFLKQHGFPVPPTVPLVSHQALKAAEAELGYPMVLKNRFGAGGGYVFLAETKRQLLSYYRISTLDLLSFSALGYLLRNGFKRSSLYHLVKAKRARYPLLSVPLLAQKFVEINRDLKIVCRKSQVVEGHWRLPARSGEWKMNIDGGGAGRWSRIPEEAMDLSRRLALALRSSWLNIDLLLSDKRFLISEFSPVWHHYAYMEKGNFSYEDDYNAELPLEEALDLEGLIVDQLIAESVRNHGCI